MIKNSNNYICLTQNAISAYFYMKISIITAVFNAENSIEKTIQSVLNQDYSNIEYIIVDGNSTDKTLEIVNKYVDKISKIVSEPDAGIYDAINKGIKLATGHYVGILHADDVFAYQGVVSDVANELISKTSDTLYADLQYWKGNKLHRDWISGKFNSQKFYFGWMPPHPTFFCKKSLFEKFGYYNLELKIAADYELMLRMLVKHKVSVCYLPKTISIMQVGGLSNKSIKNRLNANEEDKKAWKINEIKPYFFTFWLKPIRKIGQFIKPYLLSK